MAADAIGLGGGLSDAWHDAMAALLVVLVIISVLVQAVTLKILLKIDNRRSALTPYLVNIAIANLIFVLPSFLAEIASNISRGWFADKPTCAVIGLISSSPVLVTFGTFAGCVRTLYKACKNIQGNRGHDKKVIFVIWCLAFIMLIPAVPFWTKDSYTPGICGCVPIWTFPSTSQVVYFVILTMVAFVLPITVSFVYGVGIYRILANFNLIHTSFRQQQRFQEYKTISKMIIALIIVYFMAWCPYSVFGSLSLYGYSLPPQIWTIPHIVAKLSVLWNPFIYAVFSAKFRTGMKNFFRCSCRKKTTVAPFVQAALPARTPAQAPQQQLVPRSPVVRDGHINMSAQSQRSAARAFSIEMDMELVSLD